MNNIKPIPTWYKGIKFRSRLEARWAVFFDAIGIRYEYELEGFQMEDGTDYLPDFYLPDLDVWVEVKGIMTGKDQHKIDRFRKALEMPIYLIVLGSIPPETDDVLDWVYKTYTGAECFEIGAKDAWDFPYLPCVCPVCGKSGFEFDGRGARVCRHDSLNDKGYSYDDPRILIAYRKARSARFEHGENGAIV